MVEIVYCREMLAEFSEKLYEKFGFSADNVRAAVYDFRRFGQQVEITGDLRVVSSDPDDDMFVECALVAGASMIVSGDHHLLDLEEYKGIRIVTPAALLRWLVERS